VGDTITPALQIMPAMPAEVRVVVTLVPLGGGEAQTIQYEGFPINMVISLPMPLLCLLRANTSWIIVPLLAKRT
jgi:hypothetical protein